MSDRPGRSRASDGFSPRAAAALVEQLPARFEVSAGVIDFANAPWSEVTRTYRSRPAARVALAGLPEPMRDEERRCAGEATRSLAMPSGRRSSSGIP